MSQNFELPSVPVVRHALTQQAILPSEVIANPRRHVVTLHYATAAAACVAETLLAARAHVILRSGEKVSL